MAIKMNPAEFPEHRRHDPKRAAEARVFDALQNLDLMATASTSSGTARRADSWTLHSGWTCLAGWLFRSRVAYNMLDDDGQWHLCTSKRCGCR